MLSGNKRRGGLDLASSFHQGPKCLPFLVKFNAQRISPLHTRCSRVPCFCTIVPLCRIPGSAFLPWPKSPASEAPGFPGSGKRHHPSHLRRINAALLPLVRHLSAKTFLFGDVSSSSPHPALRPHNSLPQVSF